MSAPLPGPRVAVVGGGLAGLAAATSLVEQGWQVTLYEARRQLGGRAASFQEGDGGGLVDYCQHVSMGCCTQLAHFCRTTGVEHLFREDDALHFFGPKGQRSDVRAAAILPAPMHLLPSLLRLGFLTFPERLCAVRLLMRLALWQPDRTARDPTVAEWLTAQGTPDRVARRFFATVLVSALGERLELASLSAARHVFVTGFMRSRNGWRIRVPRVPLSEIFDRHVGDWLQARGVQVMRGSPVKQVIFAKDGVRGVATDSGEERAHDSVVVAVPWRRVASLFSEEVRARWPDVETAKNLDASPITGAHLWFDRPITPLPHAVIVDRLSQWVFNRGELEPGRHYLQVVVSASHDIAGRGKEDVVAELLSDLRAVFPDASGATLRDCRLVTDPAAVFSARPGSDAIRLPQATPWPNLALAGDWTRTGWPATMEGAVRSGYLVARTLSEAAGRPAPALVPDLPADWLARCLLPLDGDTNRVSKLT